LGEKQSLYKSTTCLWCLSLSWSAYHFFLIFSLSDCGVMFAPALTAFGARVTHAPSPSLSLSTIKQTTLVQAVRRDNPPNILTNDQTCGYTSGVSSSAVTCGPQASCTYYTGPNAPNFGCCTDGQGCDYVATCMDYGAKGNINSGGGVGLGNQKFMW
jgi:hypothetical protein